MPGELFFEGPVSNWFTAPIGLSFPLQLREARWMRSPRGVQDTLNAWTANAGALRSYAADPLTPAIEFAEHHPLELGAARDAALDYVLGERPQRAARTAADMDSFPLTVGSWVTGTEYAPDFFAEVGWDHTRSEMFMAPPALPRAGAPDSPQADVHDADLARRHRRLALGDGQGARRAGPAGTSWSRLHLHDGFFRSVGARADQERPELRGRAAVPVRRLRAARAGRAGRARSTPGPRRRGCTRPLRTARRSRPTTRSAATSTRAAGTGRSGTTPPRGCCTRSAPSPRARKEEPLRARFARAWTQWTASHLTLGYPMVVEHFHPETGRPYRLIPDYFHSAWLDTFFRHVVVDAARRHRSAAGRGRAVEGDGGQLGARRAWRAWMRMRKPKK